MTFIIIFNQLYCVNKNLDFKAVLYYKRCIINRAGIVSVSDFPTKFASQYDFFAISRQIGVCTTCDQVLTVSLQANPNLLNKWPLKFACAYLNTQESRLSGSHLKWLQDVHLVRISRNCPSTDVLSIAQVSFPSLTSPLNSHHSTTFLQYLGKYAFVRRATRRFWKIPWQTNPNLLNKRHLKFPCAYLNTQETSPSGTHLKRLQDVRYSMKLQSLLR
ncbi:hypothetical protein T07_8023 [Trichinella nelsoni]|uniref:Uncharacterized protein n=1 Tax=Trichinella nelsoni TaxID=6336 RepID=A0A0V0RJU3_9BILA|nr:hypothetical protein T07_8023 [Trichinella nelsoni]